MHYFEKVVKFSGRWGLRLYTSTAFCG